MGWGGGWGLVPLTPVVQRSTVLVFIIFKNPLIVVISV